LRRSESLLKAAGRIAKVGAWSADLVSQTLTWSDQMFLLITDVVMPEMNGRDLANTLLVFWPDLKCLFMSGYTANVIAHHSVLE